MDNTLCIIVIWIICGILAASIYHRKGRGGLSGFLGGFLLGPIGVILALASGDNKKKLAEREKENQEQQVLAGELKKCPHCAELIKPEAKVCRFCGRDIE
jgi:hypothetical protein